MHRSDYNKMDKMPNETDSRAEINGRIPYYSCNRNIFKDISGGNLNAANSKYKSWGADTVY